MSNKNFKLAESREFKLKASNHAFVMSPSRWVALTNAIGFICKMGRYDGYTYSQLDEK